MVFVLVWTLDIVADDKRPFMAGVVFLRRLLRRVLYQYDEEHRTGLKATSVDTSPLYYPAR